MLVDISLASLAPRVRVTLGITKLSSGSVETPPSPATAIALSQVVQGLRGPPGNAAVHYEHQQLIAAATWVVNHNLGLRPQISVLSLGGATMWAEVIHASPNQALVYFDEPQAGLALCS